MRRLHRRLSRAVPDHRARRRGIRNPRAPFRSGRESGSSSVRFGVAASNRPPHAQGRRRLRPLRAVRRALPHRGVGHAKIRPSHSLRRESMHDNSRTSPVGQASACPGSINDFAVKLANVNGTGSASANGLIMQAIFRMGIPVSGKNLFPSNIQWLPTLYEVRVNKDGHTARTPDFDLIVAMNAETYAMDVKEVASGGYVLYDSTWPLDKALLRPDVSFIGVPLAKMCTEAFAESRERVLMKNIVYVGVLVALLSIDMAVVEKILEEKFKGKPALMQSNHRAVKLGYDYATQHLECPLPLKLQKMEATRDCILIDGNT